MSKRTLEQIETDFRKREYGVCDYCKKELKYNDKFIDVAEGVCGCSQGFPNAWIDAPVRYHVKCYLKKN